MLLEKRWRGIKAKIGPLLRGLFVPSICVLLLPRSVGYMDVSLLFDCDLLCLPIELMLRVFDAFVICVRF